VSNSAKESSRVRRAATDVIIVGAGLAGLVAARALTRRGLHVRVLEARDRVGGRTYTRRLPVGRDIDLGGQWIGPGQDRIAALLAELGIGTYPQHTAGSKLLVVGGRRREYGGRSIVPPLGPLALLELARIFRRLDRLGAGVPLDAPHQARRAEEWDALTVAQWRRENIRGRKVRALFDIATQAVFAAEPSELSFLHFLYYLRSGGGMRRLVEVEGGAQQTRIAGGAQGVCERLAAGLGGAVTLEAPVRAVRRHSAGVEVFTDRGEFRARRLVVAIPPALAAGIVWEPPLPALRAQLAQRMPMGSVIKCVAIYPAPFWREAGQAGEVVCDEDPVRLVFDASPPDGSAGALVCFVLGRAARLWGDRPAAERRMRVLEQLDGFFGPAARVPADYAEMVWAAEPWSGGCYGGFFPPGALTGFGHALREPVGPIHWAGTETAAEWCGYMDGAVESGERAAAEVAAVLGAC
jgi:monoamine oxidase